MGAGGDLDVRWYAGRAEGEDDGSPPIQVHRYDAATVVMRQSMAVHWEAPFLYLLFGRTGALLVDTGATADPEAFPLRRTVDALVEEWLAEHPRRGYQLLVAHSHGHDDHVAADGHFSDRADTTVVGAGLADVVAAFGFDDWPATSRTLDLGDREVDVVPGPGHQEAATVFFDRATGLLLTGDTLYPGRLYVEDWDAYSATVDRLLALSAEREVTHVLGCHVEMSTTAGVDYPRGSVHQPDEAPLAMTPRHLRTLREALDAVGGAPGTHRFDDFVVVHRPRGA